jgi:hypothetical protein
VTFTESGSCVLAASASSEPPVQFSVDSGTTAVCAIDATGRIVTFAAPGTRVVDADQGGNDAYAAAPQVQRSISVVSCAFISDGATLTQGTSSSGSPARADAGQDFKVALNLASAVGDCSTWTFDWTLVDSIDGADHTSSLADNTSQDPAVPAGTLTAGRAYTFTVTAAPPASSFASPLTEQIVVTATSPFPETECVDDCFAFGGLL